MIERQPKLGGDQAKLDRAQLAAQKRGQREFDTERLGAQSLRIAGLADLDIGEDERRRRQQPHVHRTRDPHRQPDQRARLLLEIAALRVPIDEMGPKQRRQQRQDHRNRQC